MVLTALCLAVLLTQAPWVLLQEPWQPPVLWQWGQASGRGGPEWLPACQQHWLLRWEMLHW